MIHGPEACQGEACVFHNPSDHHMVEWPKVIRFSGLVERTCPHVIGHPDPDSMSYFVRLGKEYIGLHGCDGCCHRPLTRP